ncbi:FMN-binding protein [Nonomuraea rhodomycinica]|uniref:FMN-binding protein n=1 Tax=Nonomuraea rhodomycinica TaxID=1712872 RepID=A0A7Y6IXK1_9ACTN|nr:FMN-binding protein [Nonomuraea rhodomycinica]NUW45906.1 FMN-binding protein [Nonomuraea rhodomycinica]
MRRALLAIVVTAAGLVLLLSFKPHQVTDAGAPPAAVAQAPAGRSGESRESGDSDTTGDSGTTGDSATTGTTGKADTSGGSGAAAGRTYTGDAADTRWGPVQVRITVAGKKITHVEVVQAPDTNHRDIEINQRALPVLQQETLSAQSARIDTVSGATYTSEGYVASLQSAIDRAGL